MKRLHSLVVLMGIAALTAGASGSYASLILDQEQWTHNSGVGLSEQYAVAQTFVPQVTGSLARVDILGYPEGPRITGNLDTKHDVMLDIVPTTDGVPNAPASALGSVMILAEQVPNPGPDPDFAVQVSFDFSSSMPELTLGTEYALVLRSPDATVCEMFSWGSADSDAYATGGAFLSLDGGATYAGMGVACDMTFRTYMVPEPTSVVLFALTLAGIARLQRRRVAA